MKEIRLLDQLLLKTLIYLFEKWYKPEVGIVACALKDGDNIVFATSTRNGNNWLHAERNAYEKFKSTYEISPSKNAFFVITLSPCITSLKYRNEASCSDLIRTLGIERVHFGVLDSMYVETIATYSKFGLTATLTKNQDIQRMCSKLMDMFSIYDSRINYELLTIKAELGNDFFSPIL